MESKEWGGSGLPPVGTVCEYLSKDGNEWNKCEVVAYHYSRVVAVDVFDSAAVCQIASLFRPIKTPEQITKEERLQAIGEMLALVQPGCTYMDVMMILYDAGYRKIEVKK